MNTFAIWMDILDSFKPINPLDQDKTAFTCPYGTHAYRCTPFGLCNAPGTFKRCMMAMFSDFIENTIDHFSVYGSSFDSCLDNLSKVLDKCIETDHVLNWEKYHFMVREGIVLWFYQHFIKDFSKIAKPLTDLLHNDVTFVFDNACIEAF
ncbi:unnamed protein product [Rhodiola kirilowii]